MVLQVRLRPKFKLESHAGIKPLSDGPQGQTHDPSLSTISKYRVVLARWPQPRAISDVAMQCVRSLHLIPYYSLLRENLKHEIFERVGAGVGGVSGEKKKLREDCVSGICSTNLLKQQVFFPLMPVSRRQHLARVNSNQRNRDPSIKLLGFHLNLLNIWCFD